MIQKVCHVAVIIAAVAVVAWTIHAYLEEEDAQLLRVEVEVPTITITVVNEAEAFPTRDAAGCHLGNVEMAVPMTGGPPMVVWKPLALLRNGDYAELDVLWDCDGSAE